MATNSAIEWTDHTFNPWWGCVKVSPGCQHCYAETLSKRFGNNIWGPAKTTDRRLFDTKHWAEPRKWNAKAKADGVRARVFCASMADVFEDHPQLVEARAQLFDLIEQTPNLDWLLLTKRPENILRMLPFRWLNNMPANVWLGTSVENQEQAERRIPFLTQTGARVLFLSCEPLLGPLNLTSIVKNIEGLQTVTDVLRGSISIDGQAHLPIPPIDWVIAGGESGHGARPMHPGWARSLRDQCQAAGVAFHFKQWGQFAPANGDARTALGVPYGGMDDPDGRTPIALPDNTITDLDWNGGPGPHLRGGVHLLSLGKRAAGRLLDGRTWDEFPQ